MKGSVSIIIPTYNQPEHLKLTLYSIMKWTKSIFKIYVVDNSKNGYAYNISRQIHPAIRVIRDKENRNLGWMGGINLGIKASKEEFVLMLNDDIQVLDFDNLWLQRLLNSFTIFDNIGAVGPTSNVVLPLQSINMSSDVQNLFVPVLSGFCMLTKREIIEKIGNLDETLSGGDDLDFSMRLKNAGYYLVCRRDTYIHHYGSVTGKSIYNNYWNSKEYTEKLVNELIKKHGFKAWIDLNYGKTQIAEVREYEDWERTLMLPFCNGIGLDFGCGYQKIKEDAIGVDLTPKDEEGIAGNQLGNKSQADIQLTSLELPFDNNKFDYVYSRHVIEHITDDMFVLEELVRVVKDGGTLVIAMPDENVVDGMPLDPTHKMTYTVKSFLNKLKYICDYEILLEDNREISFVLALKIKKRKP